MTAYRSVPEQTKPKGYTYTSIGERTNNAVVAVSQDLLNGKRLRYYDTVFIEGVGFRQVLDCMHHRHKNRLDVWVKSYEEEKKFDKKFRGKKLRIWVLKVPQGEIK